MYYDFLINRNPIECPKKFDSLESVYQLAEIMNASHVRQSYRDYPSEFHNVIGEHGDWMDMGEFESAIYEYNHTRF
jgi:hypothetical protein